MKRITAMTILTLSLVLLLSTTRTEAAEQLAGSLKRGTEKIKTELKKPGGIDWHAEAGLAYDSNVYRTPESPYTDLAQAGSPTVNPKSKSGFFVPLEIGASYSLDLDKTSDLIASYDFKGDIYAGSDLGNANVYAHTLKAGPRFVLNREGARENTLYLGVFAGKHRKLYVDRDDGEQKLSGVTNISDRYNYTSLGAEGEYRSRIGLLQYSLDAKVDIRDYEDPSVVSEYDHTYVVLGGKVHYRVARRTKLSGSYKRYTRNYDDRPSRNAIGAALTSNDRLSYTYNAFGLSVRQKLTGQWTTYFDLNRTYRKDAFAGYNDYTRDKMKVRLLYANKAGYSLRLAAAWWKRTYDNAFAFDKLTGGEKKYDGINLDVTGKIKQTEHRTLWAGLGYDDQNTTDKRYEYDRYQVSAGVRWEY